MTVRFVTPSHGVTPTATTSDQKILTPTDAGRPCRTTVRSGRLRFRPGWAPYRGGRWVWEPGWGWTWVSYEPWGWAPYHYGRWFVYNSSWVWWPGPVYGYPRYRPVWAPAYVSFFGFGGGVGVGVGFGSVGWLPIGPCDRFYPWYGRYGSRFNSVNVVNITNINIHNGPGRGFGGIAPLRSGGGYSNLRLADGERKSASRNLDRSRGSFRYGTSGSGIGQPGRL